MTWQGWCPRTGKRPKKILQIRTLLSIAQPMKVKIDLDPVPGLVYTKIMRLGF